MSDIIKQPVEEWLYQVEYGDDTMYLPSDFALKFVTFIKLVNGGKGEENKTPVIHYKMLDNVGGKKQNIANLCHRGSAKALSLNTVLYTDNGTTTIRDVKIGDKIIGENGQLTVVTAKSEVFNKPMYRILLKDGRTLDVSEDHINTVIQKRSVRYGTRSKTEYQRRDLTTTELLSYAITSPRKITPKNTKGYECNFWIPTNQPVQYTEKKLPIDPYTLGLLIGDGSMCRKTGYSRLHCHKDDYQEYVANIPYNLGKLYIDKRNPNVYTVGILKLGDKIKKLGINVHGNDKFIPEVYKYGSIDQRLELLKGLMDTDGTIYKTGSTAFTSNSETLVKDVTALVRSLGGNAKYTKMCNSYRISITINQSIFKLPRKKARENTKSLNHKTGIVSITSIDTIPSQCIAVDNKTKTFIAGDYVVTHNTTVMGEYMILYIATYGGIDGFGDIPLGLYVSDSIENGVKNMRKNLEYRWANSDFLQQYIPETRFTDVRWEFKNIDGKVTIFKGYGAKALSLDSKLYTKNGTTTIGECKVGDKIFGPDGKLANIIEKSEIFHKPMYEIILEDGRKLKVSEDHINSVVYKENINNKAKYVNKDLYTYELLELPLLHTRARKRIGKPDYTSNENRLFIENCDALEYEERILPLDPYTLGLLLGDGSMKKNGSNILHGHKDDMKYYKTVIPYALGKPYIDKRNFIVESTSIKGISKIIKILGVNVHGNYKFIPEDYFYGSINQRLALLRGLMDTDGTVDKGGRCSFTSNSKELVLGLSELTRSLGGTAKIRKASDKAYSVEIWIKYNPFQLPRKAVKYKGRLKQLVAVTSINRIADEPSQCIAIDNESHQFISNSYFRTHNTGVRGAKEMGQRPYIAILDDLISDEDARSETVRASIEDTVYKAVDYALHPNRRKIIWSGTPFNANDPLYKAVESGGWYVNVYPVCEKFPCSREEFRGSWEDRFTYDFVKSQYDKSVATGKIAAFNQELMLRIMSDEDRLIKEEDLVFYDRSTVLRGRDKYNFYITTDFATSEKKSADFSVISVWAYNNVGDWLWVDGTCKRQNMSKNIDDLFRFAQIYKPQSVGIEVTGQQGGFINWIQDEMLSRNIYFNLATEGNNPGLRPKTNKMERFNVVVPLFKMRKIWFPKDMEDNESMIEAMDELRNAASSGFKSKHDDFIDTVSMLAQMNPWKPSEEATYELKDGTWYEFEEQEDMNNSLIF